MFGFAIYYTVLYLGRGIDCCFDDGVAAVDVLKNLLGAYVLIGISRTPNHGYELKRYFFPTSIILPIPTLAHFT